MTTTWIMPKPSDAKGNVVSDLADVDDLREQLEPEVMGALLEYFYGRAVEPHGGAHAGQCGSRLKQAQALALKAVDAAVDDIEAQVYEFGAWPASISVTPKPPEAPPPPPIPVVVVGAVDVAALPDRVHTMLRDGDGKATGSLEVDAP